MQLSGSAPLASTPRGDPQPDVPVSTDGLLRTPFLSFFDTAFSNMLKRECTKEPSDAIFFLLSHAGEWELFGTCVLHELWINQQFDIISGLADEQQCGERAFTRHPQNIISNMSRCLGYLQATQAETTVYEEFIRYILRFFYQDQQESDNLIEQTTSQIITQARVIASQHVGEQAEITRYGNRFGSEFVTMLDLLRQRPPRPHEIKSPPQMV